MSKYTFALLAVLYVVWFTVASLQTPERVVLGRVESAVAHSDGKATLGVALSGSKALESVTERNSYQVGDAYPVHQTFTVGLGWLPDLVSVWPEVNNKGFVLLNTGYLLAELYLVLVGLRLVEQWLVRRIAYSTGLYNRKLNKLWWVQAIAILLASCLVLGVLWYLI